VLRDSSAVLNRGAHLHRRRQWMNFQAARAITRSTTWCFWSN